MWINNLYQVVYSVDVSAAHRVGHGRRTWCTKKGQNLARFGEVQFVLCEFCFFGWWKSIFQRKFGFINFQLNTFTFFSRSLLLFSLSIPAFANVKYVMWIPSRGKLKSELESWGEVGWEINGFSQVQKNFPLHCRCITFFFCICRGRLECFELHSWNWETFKSLRIGFIRALRTFKFPFRVSWTFNFCFSEHWQKTKEANACSVDWITAIFCRKREKRTQLTSLRHVAFFNGFTM